MSTPSPEPVVQAQASSADSAAVVSVSPGKGPPWLGHTHDLRQVDFCWIFTAGTLTGSSMIFFGWRGVASIAITAIATLVSYLLLGLVIHLLRPHRRVDSLLHALAMGLLLGCAMPIYERSHHMNLLGGLTLGILAHLVGRTHRLRLHAIALTIVTLWLLPAMTVDSQMIFLPRQTHPRVESVLRPQHVVLGDVQDATEVSFESWWSTRHSDESHAVKRRDAHSVLAHNQASILQHDPLLVNMLSSGELPRLEELLLGATPGSAGASSRALIVMLGLYLLYRRLSWWQIPLAAIIGALVTLLIMPVNMPEGGSVPALVRLLQMPTAVVITYLGYMLLATPLLFIALLLAPLTAPMSASGRGFYGFILGSTMLLAQWYLGVNEAAYLSLILASAVSRPLDALQRSEWVH
jgi:hypothetical protein